PPAMVSAAIAALDVIEDEPELAARAVSKAKRFTRVTNLPEAESPIVPIVIGDADDAMEASRLLAEKGFLAPAIRPPTVPVGTSRLRLTFTAGHPDEEIERLGAVMREHVLAR
ncbi:MAG: aminotransferase class I/II-fold pyridoxal phosphate-dependent enzyme, partial [Pseudolabrys sp.]|nr:aminotransferase class I/II-fold pyridoxal phosphate-dependent enzyme [Pseudolabrys sp.]